MNLASNFRTGGDIDRATRQIGLVGLPNDAHDMRGQRRHATQLDREGVAAAPNAVPLQVLAIGIGEHADDRLLIDLDDQAHRGVRFILILHPAVDVGTINPVDVTTQRHASFSSVRCRDRDGFRYQPPAVPSIRREGANGQSITSPANSAHHTRTG